MFRRRKLSLPHQFSMRKLYRSFLRILPRVRLGWERGMKIRKTGTISKQEVDTIILEILESKLNIKITQLTSIVKQYNDPSDWRGEYPPDYIFDGYSFDTETEK